MAPPPPSDSDKLPLKVVNDAYGPPNPPLRKIPFLFSWALMPMGKSTKTMIVIYIFFILLILFLFE